MFALMARMPEALRRDTAQRIVRAARRAALIGETPIDLKTLEGILALDHGQFQRQCAAVERQQIVERLAAVAHEREDLWGDFVVCLLDEFGGWHRVLTHGAGLVMKALGRAIAIAAGAPGQARMASATSNPRSRKERECVVGSCQLSA